MKCHRFAPVLSRRDMLRTSAVGFGQLALAGLAGQACAGTNPLAPKTTHFAPTAKRMIFLFMWGGPSHVDMFDPKPRLAKDAGKRLPTLRKGNQVSRSGDMYGSPFKFRRHGDSGIWMSDLSPHLAKHADKLAVIRSVHTEGQAHGEALLRLHTGQANLVRPSVGAWMSYGLGCESDNLPGFVTVSPPRGHGGAQNYGNAFLPAVHHGTPIGSAEINIADAKISHIKNKRWSSATQQQQLRLIQQLNQEHLRKAKVDPNIEGLISSYELAFRMQSDLPRVMNLDKETKETKQLYGINGGATDNFGRQCLLARRLCEEGVRYIQVSTYYTWDFHQKNNDGHRKECLKTDKPIAGLLTDLARRGMLDDTLVFWGGEFGRTPTVENGHGRGHHPAVMSMWFAGGGIKGGTTFGATDEFGYFPIENPVHMHDVHATLLHTMGLDHTKLSYRYAGRDFRLTDVYGKVCHDVLG